MIKRYQNSAGVMTRIADAVIVIAAWLVAFPIRFTWMKSNWLIPMATEIPEHEIYLALLPLIVVLWMGGFQFFGVYRYERVIRRSTEVYAVLRAHIASLVVFTSLTYFITQYRFSRGVILIFGALVFLGCWLFRVISRKILRELNRKKIHYSPLVAVGQGKGLDFILQMLGRYPELGVDISKVFLPHESEAALLYIEQTKPKTVLLAFPNSEHERLNQIVSKLRDESLDIQIVPDYSEYMALGAHVENFRGVPLIALNESPLHGYRAWLKRLLDIACSTIGILLLSPLLVLLAILIKITSRGPVLYRQERMSLDGGTFQMLKFRSMKVDAENATGAVWAKENDDRRTIIGKFLRSTSLDELPQLWNVFIGDMSLVGPRPERPVFVGKFRHEIPNYMLRHRVKTGLTGWAQINGWRGDTSLEKRIEFDIYYIRNWSFWFDIKILFLTVFKGFVNRNAY